MEHHHPMKGALAVDGVARAAPRGRLPVGLKRALTWVVSVVIVCGTLEVSARLVVERSVFSARIEKNSDAAWRLDWARRHGDGIEVYYSFDVYHPTRGWALKPDLRDSDPYGPATLNSNSVGMRGLREYSERPPADRSRVVLIGDSFSFGEEVADSETFAHRLQELLPRAEVLNLGVHGYGHDQMLVYLREEGLRYRPSVVLVGFVQDDMERNMLEFRDYAKPRFELVDGSLALRNSPVPSPDETMARERYRSRFMDLLDMVHQAVLWRTGVNQRRMEAVTAALLDEIARESASVGAATAFAYLPHSVELMDPTVTLEAERFFDEYCRERDALCLDLRPTFLERIENGFPIKVPGHWHGSGHALVADELSTFLTDQGLVPR